MANQDPHGQGRIQTRGAALREAAGALLLLHGRGASAADILGLGQAIAPEGWALLAPEAAGHTWYPYSFLTPREENEPFLSSALRRVETLVQQVLEAGIPPERLVVAGFSQGACLTAEFVGRHPARYGGALAFTGGLIGPPGEPITLTGDLGGTPVLLSSGDPDPHVPWARVEQTAALLRGIGGQVTTVRYPGRPHTVLAAEVAQARALLEGIR